MSNLLCIHYPTVLYKRYFSHLSFTIRLFADDTIAYMAIKSTINAQQDLDNLAIWEGKWKMAFCLDKCEILSVNRNKNPISFNNTLHGHPLESL